MNDQIEGKVSLDQVNKRIKEKGGKETSSIDMIMGEDYYYDSEGVLNYTVQGELKLDAVSDILVDNANIAANNLAMDTKSAEIAKNKEDIAKLEVRISKANVNLYSRISKEIDECYERINFEEEELEHYQYLYNKFAFCSSIINNESNLENYELIYTKS